MPAALLMFWLGSRLATDLRIPAWVGAPAAVAGLVLPLLDHPALFARGGCLGCDPQFIAEPMVGRYGFAPRSGGVGLFVVVFIGNTLLHVALLRLFNEPLNRFFMLC